MQSFFEYTNEVKQAINAKKPVLALESTLITHGLPYPQNIETAKMAEEIAREHGVVPATIAIINGKIKIGLSADELSILVHDKTAVKVSRRDLPFAINKKINAGTTVAATIFCAHSANIKVFATGGIGGVHRGDAQDISADLIELAKTPIAVICAGAKSILDLPKTLEFLETFGIPLIGYGTNVFPAFYTTKSPHVVPDRIDTIDTLVNVLQIHWQLNSGTSVLIANPIPEKDEISDDLLAPAIVKAMQLAQERSIVGKEITPFLLSEIAQITQGKSLTANIELIKNNVQLGAKLARALSPNYIAHAV